MAGRPLRRLREAAMMNPLVGWEDLSGLTARQALEPDVPLVAAGAKAKYAEVYTRVGLPLAVVLHPPQTGGKSAAEEREERAERRSLDMRLAEKHNAIVLSTRLRKRKDSRHYSQPGQQRGSPDRTSPMTPFVLLHRLGDELLTPHRMNNEVRQDNPAAYYALKGSMREVDDLIWDIDSAENDWVDELRRQERAGLKQKPGYTDEKDYLSRGVDTAAGRMGVISTDYLSDLWAKWLLTGRVAYSTTNPPPESVQESTFRKLVAEHAPKIFQHWHRYLLAKIPTVIAI